MLLCPWDSPGKNAGVGCHSILTSPLFLPFPSLFVILAPSPLPSSPTYDLLQVSSWLLFTALSIIKPDVPPRLFLQRLTVLVFTPYIPSSFPDLPLHSSPFTCSGSNRTMSEHDLLTRDAFSCLWTLNPSGCVLSQLSQHLSYPPYIEGIALHLLRLSLLYFKLLEGSGHEF